MRVSDPSIREHVQDTYQLCRGDSGCSVPMGGSCLGGYF